MNTVVSKLSTGFSVLFFLTSLASAQLQTPSFDADPTVHDPSVVKVGERYYVFGSHLGAAWTEDLMNWTQISTDAGSGNTLIPNVSSEMQEVLSWAETNTFWAPDVFELPDGRFYMYYCASRGDSPRSGMGLAVADSVEGPYSDLGVFLLSGMWNQISPDGTIYDATVHPNAVDPAIFYDAQGKLWMIYGSYSGGILIMEINPETGFPYPNQGYGKKLLGGNHARIEGAYVVYYPKTGYYYMFVSFGGLGADGGYNVRVCRSENPDGPYYDSEGTDMITVMGAQGTLFDDVSIAPHGVKLMGNWRFLDQSGEPLRLSRGYVSPGHNSAYYDEVADKTYMFFHTRFVGTGEIHNVRVHQVYWNEEGWPVIAPHRYAQETLGRYQEELFYGAFKVIEHGKDIASSVKESQLLELASDGSVSGYKSGSWELVDGRDIRITLDGEVFRGVASHQWDDDNQVWVMAFSALSTVGEALWGSQVASSLSLSQRWRLRHFGSSANVGDAADTADADGDAWSNLLEYACGTNPHEEDGTLLAIQKGDNGSLEVRFETVFDPDLLYTLESSHNLEVQSWTKWGDLVRGDLMETQLFELPIVAGEVSTNQQFWRLGVEVDEE